MHSRFSDAFDAFSNLSFNINLFTNKNGPIQHDPVGFEYKKANQSWQMPEGFDPASFEVLERQLIHLFSELALEVMHLTLAAIKCDFMRRCGRRPNAAPYLRLPWEKIQGKGTERASRAMLGYVHFAASDGRITKIRDSEP
jgi:hypothetical protein